MRLRNICYNFDMQYLKRLRGKSGDDQIKKTNWSVLSLLIVGAGGLTWYVLHLPEPVTVNDIDIEVSDTVAIEDVVSTSTDVEPTSTQEQVSYTGTLRLYRDEEVGIEFSYPVEWGVIISEKETGDCPEYQKNCFLKRYMLQDPSTGQYSTLAAAVTQEYRDHPSGRGSQWYDQLLLLPEDLSEWCVAPSCRIWPTEQELFIAGFESEFAFESGDISHDTSRSIHRYVARLQNSDYTHFIISTEIIPNGPLFSEYTLQETVIRSLAEI